MTREEEIIEVSQLYAKAQQKPFMDGAMWADKHPTEEVQRLKRMFESDSDVYEQGYNDAIEKACNLLKTMINEVEYYSDDNTPHFDKDEFIKEIRNIMKQQQ